MTKGVRGFLLTSIALPALLSGGNAAAQLPTGRSGMSDGWSASTLDAMKEMASFGRCYARTIPKDVLKIMATTPGTAEEAAVFRKVLDSEDLPCMSPGTLLSMPVPYIRGAMVEGYYKAQLPVPADLRRPAPPVAEVRSVGDAARCYAAGHLTEVTALLGTPAGSKAEHELAAKMMPDFLACLPKGGTVRLNATLFRYKLAEALVRLDQTGGR